MYRVDPVHVIMYSPVVRMLLICDVGNLDRNVVINWVVDSLQIVAVIA